jgi:transglutaminase-like putative cysteine protease
MPDFRPALLALVPGIVLMESWLRLEHPQRDAGRMLLLLGLAVIPALARRLWQRLLLVAAALVLAVDLAARVPLLRPWYAPDRLWNGFVDFYEVRLPFHAEFHPEMHALLILAGFGFTAGVALAAASRKPVAAVAFLVVGAGWPATLLTNGRDVLRGAVILATALFLLACLRAGALTLGRAAFIGGVLIAAAVAATTQPAVAKSEFLDWQTWQPYKRPPASVGVRYVWNASYDGFKWPRKTTTVLKIKAPARSVYWRATTLDAFNGTSWFEQHSRVRPQLFDGRLDLTQDDPLVPLAARDPERWDKVDVEVEAFADDHLVAPSVPVGYSPGFGGAEFWQGGTATLPRGLERGEQYTAWSYSPDPTPAELERATGQYPAAVLPYLDVYPGLHPPAFGAPHRNAVMQLFLDDYGKYRELYGKARQVVGDVKSPYGAALALEAWLRGGGGFAYTTQPPLSGSDPLEAFVLQTKRGYCQHFAGAMALMLRYLGVPARVAEGFVSGDYDQGSKTWTVTDHDAHAWVEVWFPRYGWLPFDPTPGRGFLSAPYSVSSPDFRPAAVKGIVGGAAASLLTCTACLHQNNSFGDKDANAAFLATDPRRGHPSPGFGLQHRGGSLGKLLALVLAIIVALVALAKAVRRHVRYATTDPRGQAAACRADLRDFLADQRISVAPSLAPDELAALVRAELEVDATRFASALAAARFGPSVEAPAAAARARAELARLRDQVRRRLGVFRRARGLVSLRSLGFAG